MFETDFEEYENAYRMWLEEQENSGDLVDATLHHDFK